MRTIFDWATFLCLPVGFLILLLHFLRFSLPIKLRIRFAWLDELLCKVGSHRCVCLCGRGCCWDCIRCHPEDVLKSFPDFEIKNRTLVRKTA